MKSRTKEFKYLIQEAREVLYFADESFSATESETEEEAPVLVDDSVYDGIADLFKQETVKLVKAKLSEEGAHDASYDKDERAYARFRDANNKSKIASKEHRFEMAVKREVDAFQKMGPKQEEISNQFKVKKFFDKFESQGLFQKHTGRNNRRYQAVSEALALDKECLPAFKK